jgi:hypothetical protein
VFLLVTMTVVGCGVQPPPRPVPTPIAEPARPLPTRTGRVAILLPLSGTLEPVGRAMLNAAQLALPEGGVPTPLVKDTQGDPETAALAARAAIADGAGLLLGPLTAPETAAVAPIATAAGIPVLAFTNSAALARPGVWILGISPAQQVRRLVRSARAQGKENFAALLPDSDFGRAMADALTRACAEIGVAAPNIRYHAGGTAAITAAVREISGYATRRGPVDAQIRAARAEGTAEGRRKAAELNRTPIPPAPFDALLLADTGEDLQLLAAVLPYYDVDPPAVRIMGPLLWATPASGARALPGAWYAAPDPALRASVEAAYAEKYSTPSPPVADLAYDAAAIARVLAERGGYTAAALTQQAGFNGANGWFVLGADGSVRRGLAVFQIEPTGPAMIEPAPESAAVPGS